MPIRAGFAEADISPPLGTLKLGWIKEIVIESVLDPIFARAAVFECDGAAVGFIQLDTLCIRHEDAEAIRTLISAQYGFPGANVMVAATHNHAGPAVDSLGEVPLDHVYTEGMVEKAASVFGQTLARMQECRIGVGSTLEWSVSHNRRMVMRDGTVQTHTGYSSPDALYVEGPIDPEVFVLVAKDAKGQMIGAMVNFACHPTHHGDDTVLSAGFPGVLAREMSGRGCPIALFLNGAAGNLSPGNPVTGDPGDMEEIGRRLALAVDRALSGMEYKESARLGSRSRTVKLPYREVNGDEIRGTVRGAQRFIDPAIYDRFIPEVVEEIRRHDHLPAQVQAISFDDHAFAGFPGEYFVQLGLRVKEQSYPVRTHVVGYANGYVGYLPHRKAIDRGGYETTFGWGSKLAPHSGDLLADAAVDLIKEGARS